MEKQCLYFIFNKPTHTINRTIIFNMPNPVAEMLETKFKIEELIGLSKYNLAQLYQMAKELIQNHYKN